MFRKKILFVSLFFILILCSSFVVNAQNEEKPYITKLTPNQGPVGTEIVVLGSSFEKEKGKVSFYQSKTTTNIISWNDQEIICKVPSDAKSGNVLITDEKGTKSNVVKFKILSGILIAPSDLKAENATTNDVDLKWSQIKNAIAYTISMGTDTEATNLKSINVKSNEFKKTELEPNKTYYWKVKALASTPAKNSRWSRISKFTTKTEQPKPTTTTTSQKGISWASIIIIAGLVFVLILAIFILIRILSRRRKAGLDNSELNPEPTEGPLPSIPDKEEKMPQVESYERPGIDNISKLDQNYPKSNNPPPSQESLPTTYPEESGSKPPSQEPPYPNQPGV
jgi:hypothetical protein